MHIVFVAGLPGSGKTRYSDSLVLNAVQRGQTAIALDDLSVLGPEEREARKAHIRKCRPDLVVVADVFFFARSGLESGRRRLFGNGLAQRAWLGCFSRTTPHNALRTHADGSESKGEMSSRIFEC
jgi:hypothetical protein